MRNLHKAYYKDYFSNLNFGYLISNGEGPKAEIKLRNDKLIAVNLLTKIQKNPLVNKDFELKIDYPGLVTGIGIDHEAKIDGEFKLGVHFDWTYGMPVIYGSSVKGVLRSAFISKVEKGKITEYNDYFLNKVTKEHQWCQKEIEFLFKAIFVGKDYQGNNLSIYKRDIFFDAVITKPDKKGRILGSDSITPHGFNPLKNPTPLTFLKIAPGCTLVFRFRLQDTEIPVFDKDGNCVKDKTRDFKASLKETLFKEILTTIGIGAKTNLGYGQLK